MRKHTVMAGMLLLGVGLLSLPGILSWTETPYVQAAAMEEDDPFTVPVMEVLAFQEQIREAVEQEDVSALENLCSFPLRAGPNGEHLLMSGDDLLKNLFLGQRRFLFGVDQFLQKTHVASSFVSKPSHGFELPLWTTES